MELLTSIRNGPVIEGGEPSIDDMLECLTLQLPVFIDIDEVIICVQLVEVLSNNDAPVLHPHRGYPTEKVPSRAHDGTVANFDFPADIVLIRRAFDIVFSGAEARALRAAVRATPQSGTDTSDI